MTVATANSVTTDSAIVTQSSHGSVCGRFFACRICRAVSLKSAERIVDASGVTAAVALDDGLAAVLSRGSAGRAWLEWFRISTGKRLGKKEVAGTTLPSLAVQGPWILYRSSHALRVLATGSGRSWTVWRPAEAQLGARLLGRNISWAEADGGRSRLWTLRLPADD